MVQARGVAFAQRVLGAGHEAVAVEVEFLQRFQMSRRRQGEGPVESNLKGRGRPN